VVRVFEDRACPTPRCASEVGDHKKDLLLVFGIGYRTHAENEEALRDKGAILREFTAKRYGLVNLRLAKGFGSEGRSDRSGTLEGCNMLTSLSQFLPNACKFGFCAFGRRRNFLTSSNAVAWFGSSRNVRGLRDVGGDEPLRVFEVVQGGESGNGRAAVDCRGSGNRHETT